MAWAWSGGCCYRLLWWCWRWWFLLGLAWMPLMDLAGFTYTSHGALRSVDGALRTYEGCADAFADNNAASREVTLEVRSGDVSKVKVSVFCMFNGDGTGFVFVSRKAVIDSLNNPFDLDQISKDRSKVLIRVLFQDGRQEDTIIQQLDLYQNHKLTLLLNNYEGFAKVKNAESMGPQYVYLGVLDEKTAAKENAKQGFVSNNMQVDFINCDGSPDSYFAFFPQKNIPSRGSHGSLLVKKWRQTATQVPKDKKVPPEEYAYMLELDFGGCGAFETSSEWRNIRGAAFAMPFTYDSCGDPGFIEGSSRELAGMVFTSHVAYTCNMGYRHVKGNLNRKCSPDRGWTGVAPVCQRVRCTVPPESEGVIRSIDPPGRYYDSIINSSCIPGYQPLYGNATQKCLQEGKWSGLYLSCTRISCGKPQPVAFSKQTGTAYLFRDVISYVCLPGYVFSNVTSAGSDPLTISRRCTSTGYWSGVTPVCSRASCGMPSPIEHGTPVGSSHLFGDIITYECDPGYTTSDDVTIICLSNATWGGQPPTCQRISCVIPPIVDNAQHVGERRYGDKVIYKCNYGYKLTLRRSSAELTCNKYGYWSGPTPACQRITCGDPGPATNAQYSGTYFLDDQVLYVCNQGYVFAGGDAVLVCQADGRWQGAKIVCQEEQNPANVPVFCPPAPSVSNATWEALDAYLIPVNTLVTYRCIEDHEFKDESTRKAIVCLSNGRWNKNPGHCDIKRCRPLPEVRHGHVVRADPVIFSWHEAFCDVGYEFPDGTRRRSVICLKNKKWSAPLDDCRPIPCSQEPLTNTNVVYVEPEENATRPEVDKYVCQGAGSRSDVGTRLQITSCGNNGLWTRPIANCSAENCFAPPLVENATLLHGYGVYAGAVAHFLCQRGSRFPSGRETHHITCLGRDWDETVVQPCSVTNCPVPRDVPDATLHAAGYFYSGTIIRYECDYGFRFAPGVHQVEVECLATGFWDVEVGQCQRILCPDLETLTGAILDSPNRTVDSTISARCPAGQRYPLGESNSVIKCQLTGNWSGLLGHCRGERCPPVPRVTNADFSTLVADRGTKVVVMCRPGFVLLSNGERTYELVCGEQDEWVGQVENCSPVYCGPSPSLPLATTNQSGLYFGDWAVVSCLPGYRFWDDVKDVDFHCQEDATWSLNLTDLVCQPLHCPPIPYVGNSTPSGVDTVYNTVITYSCLYGYWDPRYHTHHVSTRCTETGLWAPPVHDCWEIECPPVPIWLPIIPDATWKRFGVTINYTCPINTTFSTFEEWRTANCTIDGEWFPTILPCEDIPDNTTIPPKEAKGSDTIGTFAVILCGFVFGSVIVLDCITIQKDILILRRNLAGCMPCLAPPDNSAPSRQDDFEMMPLMSTRSRMYTCETTMSDGRVIKSFVHPDVKLFHGDSDLGLDCDYDSIINYQSVDSPSSSSARSFDPFLNSTISPVILKPHRLNKTFSSTFTEGDSAETYLSSFTSGLTLSLAPKVSCPLADDENWDDDDLISTGDVGIEAIDLNLSAGTGTIDHENNREMEAINFNKDSGIQAINLASNTGIKVMDLDDISRGVNPSNGGVFDSGDEGHLDDLDPTTRLFCDVVQQMCSSDSASTPSPTAPLLGRSAPGGPHGSDIQHGMEDSLSLGDEAEEGEDSPLVKGRMLQNGNVGIVTVSGKGSSAL